MRIFPWAPLLAILFVFASILQLSDLVQAIRWLALRQVPGTWNSTRLCRQARRHAGLVRRQVQFCKRSLQMMPHLVKAAHQTTLVCQQLFSDRRWNCSSVTFAPTLTPDLTSGTREQAYVYALSSAAAAYTIARACASGSLDQCTCASPPREPPHGDFQWGGCGDNLKVGLQVSRVFADAPDKVKKVRKTAMSAVNIHNNRAGRRAVEDSLQSQCKCHGVSGSCNVKTCWRALPRLMEVGERLKRKYVTATEVTHRRGSAPVLVVPIVGPPGLSIGALGTRSGIPRPLASQMLLPANRAIIGPFSDRDLIYSAKSPDYCLKDARFGSLGTRGRWCNASSTGYLGCESMCCGRGHHTAWEKRAERCHCKYYWCCYVKCKKCERVVEVHHCL